VKHRENGFRLVKSMKVVRGPKALMRIKLALSRSIKKKKTVTWRKF